MTFINLDAARTILDAAFAEAQRRGTRDVAAVVTDVGGNVRAAYRSDGWGAFGIDIATAKARTALGFSRSTLQTGATFRENPSAVTGINAAVGGNFIPLGGGIIVTDAAGEIIGAAACAGGAPDADHEVIVAAVKAAGLNTPA